jgi:hypothetical protein
MKNIKIQNKKYKNKKLWSLAPPFQMWNVDRITFFIYLFLNYPSFQLKPLWLNLMELTQETL